MRGQKWLHQSVILQANGLKCFLYLLHAANPASIKHSPDKKVWSRPPVDKECAKTSLPTPGFDEQTLIRAC